MFEQGIHSNCSSPSRYWRYLWGRACNKRAEILAVLQWLHVKFIIPCIRGEIVRESNRPMSKVLENPHSSDIAWNLNYIINYYIIILLRFSVKRSLLILLLFILSLFTSWSADVSVNINSDICVTVSPHYFYSFRYIYIGSRSIPVMTQFFIGHDF